MEADMNLLSEIARQKQIFTFTFLLRSSISYFFSFFRNRFETIKVNKLNLGVTEILLIIK